MNLKVQHIKHHYGVYTRRSYIDRKNRLQSILESVHCFFYYIREFGFLNTFSENVMNNPGNGFYMKNYDTTHLLSLYFGVL